MTSFQILAQRIWPQAEWITGEGPFALLAHCRVLTITLHQDLARAEQAKQRIDTFCCGGACSGCHELLELAPEGCWNGAGWLALPYGRDRLHRYRIVEGPSGQRISEERRKVYLAFREAEGRQQEEREAAR